MWTIFILFRSSEKPSTKNTKNHKGRNSSRLFVNYVDNFHSFPLLRKTVHKEHEESQRKKLFASLRELCGQFSFFSAPQKNRPQRTRRITKEETLRVSS